MNLITENNMKKEMQKVIKTSNVFIGATFTVMIAIVMIGILFG